MDYLNFKNVADLQQFLNVDNDDTVNKETKEHIKDYVSNRMNDQLSSDF
jgi:hypothetical protein